MFQLQYNNCFSPQDNHEGEQITYAREDGGIITGLSEVFRIRLSQNRVGLGGEQDTGTEREESF